MSNLLSYRLARRSWTRKVLSPIITVVPNGNVREAAIVIPCMGLCPFAVIPFALGPQHSLQAQYAVMVAVMMLVVMRIRFQLASCVHRQSLSFYLNLVRLVQ